MSKKRIKKVTDAGFIPGIYNYCDRWCERCKLRAHCVSFAMESKIEEKGLIGKKSEIALDINSPWGSLLDMVESTLGVLHEIAEEHGLEVEDIFEAENIRPQMWIDDSDFDMDEELDEYIRSSELIKMSQIYEHLAEECLDNVFEELDEKEESTGEKHGEIPEVVEALEVLNRYIDLLRIKLTNALQEGYPKMSPRKKRECKLYAIGSSKVALLGIERMLESWEIIKGVCPKQSRLITHQMLILNQLAKDTERKFPAARTFLRPGFEC